MAAVKWKEPWSIPRPALLSALVFTLLIILPSDSHSQWISYKRSGRNSNLWHPNMPAPRTLRHSSFSSSSSSSNSRDSHSQSRSSSNGHRPIEHRSVNHNNYYTLPGSRDASSSGGAYHGQQQQQHQARYSSADFGRSGHSPGSSASSSGKSVRISDIPARASPSSPTPASSYQQQPRSYHHPQSQIPSNVLNHRHLPMNAGQHPKNSKVNWQAVQKSGRSGASGIQDSTKRPVSQHAGHLLDSWPNSNTHHHLAPVANGGNAAAAKSVKNGFSNLKPEQWGNNVLVSNKPIEIGVKSKMVKPPADKATDRQLILPTGYPVKDKTAVAKTINTLTKLSPKKPIFVFMRKEGITAVKSGADAGDVIKKLAGTSKLPFYNGTSVLPTHSIPTVFLAPEDMTPPSGYGKIPIPNLKPKNSTPKPTYSKILMPGGTHMKGALITTTIPTTTTTSTTTPSPPLLQASPSSFLNGGLEGIAGLLQNNSINTLSWEQKLQLLQMLRSQPDHPLADQVSLAILASASTPPGAPAPSLPPSQLSSASSPVPSPIAPAPIPGMVPIVHGPTLAAPSQWPPQLFQGVLPQGSIIEGISGQNQPPPFMGQQPPFQGGVVSSTTISSLLGSAVPSPSPSGEPATVETNDIHKLIGTIVESAVSNTVSTMLQHQRILQQQNQHPQGSLIGVGPPLHAHNMVGVPSRPPPPPPPHFGRGPPPPPRPPQGPRPPFGFQQRPPFPPSPAPGRFPPHHPSAGPPPQQHAFHPSGPPPPPPPSGIPQYQQNPSGAPPQNPSAPPYQFAQPTPSPTPTAAPPQHPSPTGAPHPSPYPFPPQQQQQLLPQASQQRPSGPVQHPLVPGFQLPPGYPTPSSISPTVSTTPSPQFAFNPSSTIAPFQYPQQQQHPGQQQQQPYHPNGIRPPHGKHPLMRMVERPYPGNKPRNPLHNALQFFGISTPRPDPANKSPSPSPTPALMSSTPYPPRPPMSPTPFGRPGPHHPFPSSTPGPQQRPQPSPFPPHQQPNQQQPQYFQHQQQTQQVPQFQHPQQLPPPSQQSPLQQQQQQQGKKPTLIVQTPNGPTGKKNTYVITGGGNELPELNKIMKVLNDLHVDSENGSPSQQQSPQPPLQQYSPSPSTPMPTTPRPAIFAATQSTMSPTPTQFYPTHRPTPFGFSPNVMIKNANQGITPSPGGASSASTTAAALQQFIASSTTPSSIISPSSGRPHIVSSTSGPLGNVSPIMQIIKSIQSQIPGVQVSPSVETFAEKQNQQSFAGQEQQQQHHHHHPTPSPSSPRPIMVSSQRPMVSVTPGPIMLSSPRPQMVSGSPGPIMFSSPRPHQGSPTPTPVPGQVIISSTGFPRVINVSPSASDTPQSIHQAVVEAIMKQQAAEAGASPSPGSQIVVTGGAGLPAPGPTSQFIEVIPAGGAIPGLGGNPSAKPFVVQLQHQQQPPQHNQQEQHHHSNSQDIDLPGLNLNNDPNVHIQKGSLDSHEVFTEKSRKQSVSSHSMSMSTSVESGERPRPVYSRERYNDGAKTHHHSKEVSDEYPEKSERRRPSYGSHSKEHFDLGEEAWNPNRRMYSGENSKQELRSDEQHQQQTRKEMSDEEKMIERVITEEKIVWKQGPSEGELIPAKVRTEERIIIRPNGAGSSSSREVVDSEFSQRRTPLSSADLMNRKHGGNSGGIDIASIERLLQQESSSKQITGPSSSQSQSKELSSSGNPRESPSNFAGILRSKMKFDKMMERLYPSKQLVSPFTISNNSANFRHQHGHHSNEAIPTIASSLITTPQGTPVHNILSSMGPTVPSIIASTLNGLISSPSPTAAGVTGDQGRFKVRPGDVLSQFPPEELQRAQQQHGLYLGVSPSGQPMIIQQTNNSPMRPTAETSSGTTEVEQRLIFIPQGTAASAPNKSNKPKILITTVDELPDLMAQLSGSGTNPEVRMVPDKATLEAELAKIAASSTVEAQTQKTTSASTTTTPTPQPPPPPSPSRPLSPSDMPPSVQSTLFRISPTPVLNNNGIRRMDGPEKAFTWHPQINTTVASPISTTMSFDNTRRLVSGLGAGMLHAMSAGFGNVGSNLLNKYSWLGPSAIPQQQQQFPPQQHQQQQQPVPTQQVYYSMQNGIPVPISTTVHQQQKLPIVGPYQQVLIQQQQQHPNDPNKETLQMAPGGAPLGYFSYKWGNLLPEQPPTVPTTSSTTAASTSTKSPDYTLKYRSQYKEDELPVAPKEESRIKPVGPVHKLKKGVKARVKMTTTTVNPIDPVSAEEYEDEEEDDNEQDDLIPHETLVPKHAGRNKYRNMNADDNDDDDDSSPEDRRPPKKQAGHRRRRPGKLTREDEDEEDVEEHSQRKRQKSKIRPTKPTYDEEDDASPAPKSVKTGNHGGNKQNQNNRRSDVDRSSEADVEDEDYEVYDVKPVFNVNKRKKVPPTTPKPTPNPKVTTPAKSSKNKAIYVNREMFMVSGEERSKESNNPKAEPVYQPNSPQLPALNSVTKYPILQAPSIISGQSVVIKAGGSANSDELKTTTTLQPKPTSASTTTTTTTTAAATTKSTTTPKAKSAPTAKGKQNEHAGDDYKDAQDELRTLLKKIQDRLTAQDEVYDFGEDQTLYDYYDDLNQQVLSTKATLASTTTKATQKPGKKKSDGKKNKNKKKSGGSKKNGKKSGKKNKKNGKKGKKNKNKNNVTLKPKQPNKKIVAVTQSIPTRRPVQITSTTPLSAKTTSEVYLQHHQRHPVSSLEQFTNEEQQQSTTAASTTTTSTTSSTTTTPAPRQEPSVPMAHSLEEGYSSEGRIGGSSQQHSGSVEQASSTRGGVSYVFSENSKDNAPRMKKRPLWVRRRMGGVANGGVVGGSGEGGLQSVRMPNAPPGKVIRLVRRRRPMGGVGRRRMMQQRRQQQLLQEQQQQQEQQQESVSSTTTSSTSTHSSIEVAPPNYSSPPLEQYFEQNSLERRVGNPDSNEKVNGTVTLRSPKRKLKLIRLKGQRAQWRLRLQGNGEEDSSLEGGPRPSALIAPREVSAPLPLQAPLPAPVYTSQGLHSPASSASVRAAKSASDMITHYTTSYASSGQSESESSSVEARVCVKGKCQVVSRQ